MILLVIFGLFVLSTQAVQAVSSQIPLQTDFRSPQKIGFSAVGGGASHYHWVLTILREMHQRGHEATLYTRVRTLLKWLFKLTKTSIRAIRLALLTVI